MSSFDDSFKRAMAAAKPGPRNETEKDDTSIWAVVAGGNAIFAGLRTGTHFRFPRSAATEVLTKASGGWYVDQRGQRFRTGAKTAVIELEKAITVGSSHTAQVRTPRAFLGEEIRYPIEINPVTNKGERNMHIILPRFLRGHITEKREWKGGGGGVSKPVIFKPLGVDRWFELNSLQALEMGVGMAWPSSSIDPPAGLFRSES